MKEGTKKTRKGLIITLSVLGVLAIAVILWFTVFANMMKYNDAKSKLEAGNFETAITSFEKLQDYGDAPGMVLEGKYLYAQHLVSEDKIPSFEKAVALYSEIPGYKDAGELEKECKYLFAKKLLNNHDSERAVELCESLGDYKDCPELLIEYKYQAGLQNFTEGNFAQAKDWFTQVSDYQDSASYLSEIEEWLPFQGTWKLKENPVPTFLVLHGRTVSKIIEDELFEYSYTVDGSTIQLHSDTFALSDDGKTLTEINPSDPDFVDVYIRLSDNLNPNTHLPPKVGMTKEEVENSSWGKPEEIIENFNDGIFEVWEYSNNRSVWFDPEGIVLSIDVDE